jgi:hypothetical protein
MAVRWLEQGPAGRFLFEAPPLEAVTGGVVLTLLLVFVLVAVLARVVVQNWLDGG